MVSEICFHVDGTQLTMEEKRALLGIPTIRHYASGSDDFTRLSNWGRSVR